MSRLVKLSLGFIGAGLLTLSLIFAYYHFHWGVEPCKGLPSDPSNCGDADFGGVYFVLVGVPLILAGLLGLVYAAVRHVMKK